MMTMETLRNIRFWNNIIQSDMIIKIQQKHCSLKLYLNVVRIFSVIPEMAAYIEVGYIQIKLGTVFQKRNKN